MPNRIKKIAAVVRQWRQLRRMPLRLEFVLTDYCNLNCKGCTHYSPLAKREFADLEATAEVMEHLGKACGSDIASAYLIGGETLLYPRLTEAMEHLRKAFPTQKLYIFTNGLALHKMSEEFWETAGRLDFIMAITRYPVKFDYDAAIESCHNHGVATEIFGDRSMEHSFFRFALDPHKKQNKRISHFKCYNRGCVSVIGDRIYPCSISGCVSHMNKALGTDFRHEPGDWLEARKVRSADEIRRLRDRPVPFCGYCILPPDDVPYGPSRRDASEWVSQ